MGKPLDWKPEYVEFIKCNYKGVLTKVLTDDLNRKFGTDFTEAQVLGFKKRNGLKSGIDTKFKKGDIPATKGVKLTPEQYEKSKISFFKKGHRPKNAVPVGTEVVRKKDGYVKIKIAEPNVWKLKHRLVWESHYGEVPKDSLITFRDGDKQNCNIDNLILVKKSVSLQMTREKFHDIHPECKDSAVVLCEYIVKTREIKKGSVKNERKKRISDSRK